MSSESELSDKEWRQMRRQMPKLHFDPVPETPALLPRSLYGEIDDKELTSIREDEESAKDLSSHVEEVKKDCKCSELPSTSMAVSPLIARRVQFQEQKLLPAKEFHLDDAELAAIDAEMTAAHDATRRSVMRAFIDFKAKKARTEALERMKLSEAHSNDVKILQDKLEEMKAQVATAEAKHEQCDLVLDRFSMFSAKQSHHNQERWSGGYSLAACFRMWKKKIRQKVEKHFALRRVLLHYCKRQQCESFRHWNTVTLNHLLQKQLQDQKDWYEHKIVEMAKEYQIKIQQLQQEVDDAKCQVTDAQKCCQKLEEDLRLIFLRGVSAMNIEALTAFRSSHKHRHTLGEPERSDLPTRQKEKSSNQVAESVKTVKIAVPEVMPPPKELPTNTTPETSDPVPVVAVEPVDVSSSQSPSKGSKVRSSYSQASLAVDKGINGQSRPSSTTELRSAEMIRKHELPVPMAHHSEGRLIPSTYRPYSAPSPTKTWSRPQLNAKYQVEMQYMRSEVAASAARSRTRVARHPPS
ncbi:Centrosomal protein POC5 [Phytophthora citrophthora]|uniref:Centrosomal protein POC5 n=1 Tax=Phytophthora citrophthora TaxID=4793 RepID=A0AAD9GVG7_9STRA|nr:Centrosomal protein POC5 [Phytophthora citrophthora]